MTGPAPLRYEIEVHCVGNDGASWVDEFGRLYDTVDEAAEGAVQTMAALPYAVYARVLLYLGEDRPRFRITTVWRAPPERSGP